MDSYKIQREQIREPRWRALAAAIGGENGEEIVDAMKELYEVYTPDAIDWFASLYDVSGAGWYYSASARDNDSREYKGKTYLLRPDLESTSQALGFFESSGMIEDFDNKLSLALPDWMQNDLSEWTLSLQDPDGYFYHEHWGKDINFSRRSRDLMWANKILNSFGRTKKYVSISDGAKAKESKDIVLPEHLKSKEKFAEFLKSRNINEQSYSTGHELTCQTDMIKHAGLVDQCIDFLNEHQFENGLWHKEENYFAINGVMKITCVYNGMHRIVPHAKALAGSCIRVLLSDEPVNGAVDLFNPWFAIGNLIRSLRECGENGEREAEEVIRTVRAAAPEAIRATAKKVVAFKKESGSFSYGVNFSSQTSQGMPVAIERSPEGDINGHILAATGLLSHVYRGLDLSDYKVPLFVRCDFDRYMSIIEKRRLNVKTTERSISE